MTLVEKLNRLPPCLCRLLAKHDGKLMTDVQLMRTTGWSKKKLERISRSRSWSKISVEDADWFLLACSLSWSAQRKKLWMLKLASEKGLDGIRRMRHLRSTRKSVVTMLLRRTERILMNS